MRIIPSWILKFWYYQVQVSNVTPIPDVSYLTNEVIVWHIAIVGKNQLNPYLVALVVSGSSVSKKNSDIPKYTTVEVIPAALGVLKSDCVIIISPNSD